MSRRKKRIERDNPERWMVSYADFITLLFAFFVVMYAISSVNEGKYKIFSLSLNSQFGQQSQNIESGSVRLTEQELYFKSLVDRRNARLAELQRQQEERMQALFNNLTEAMAPFIASEQMTLAKNNLGVVLEINASALYKPGEAEIQPDARQILVDVAALLKDGTQAIQVEGHTDNVAIKTVQFPSNWELSSARASSVVRMFIDQGISASRLRAVGMADNQAIANNATPEGRAKNRRVTITILADPVSKLNTGLGSAASSPVASVGGVSMPAATSAPQ